MDHGIKEIIIKDTAKYSFAQYTAQGIGFIISTALRAFLGPYYMGIWSILQVILCYITYLSLGVTDAAAYKIPFYRGSKDKSSEEEVKNTAFSFIFAVSLLSSLGLIVAALLLRKKYPVEVIVGLLSLAIYIILQRFYSFYIILIRAYKNITVLSRSMIFDAIVNLVLMFLIVKQFRLYGLYITISILAVLNTLFIYLSTKYDLSFKFSFKRLKSLVLFGLPLSLNGFLDEILKSIDRIMIASMMGITAVGYYSVAIMGRNYISRLSAGVGVVTIPHIQEIYGKTKEIYDIKKFVIVPTLILSYLLPPFLGAAYLASPLFVKLVLPQYTSGILALQIMFLSTFFLSCAPQPGQFLITIGKQARLIPISLAAIIVNIGLNYIFIKNGFGVSGVAVATSISSFLVFFTTLIYAMKHFANINEITLFILKIIWPLFYIISIIIGCEYFVKNNNPYLLLGIKIVIICIAALPLFYIINKKSRIFDLFIKSFKNKLEKMVHRDK
ncbi:MAG: oligosaccharide flippase family protein [Candidatus Omnitrophota bacterium]